MSEYSKMKNDELSALLKERKLPHTGKKAEMVERLQKDNEKASAQPPTRGEDEIDWDDEDDDVAAPTTTTAPQEETVITNEETVANAGGEGQPPNPQAVPNQVADIDPAQTDDLTVEAPAEGTETKPEEKKEPTPDYSRGLAATKLDEEIEKRKKRALKFGTKFEDDEALKKLERAKKFGEVGPPKGLDEALPEQRERRQKRGREGAEDAGNNKRRDTGRDAGRTGGRGGRRENRHRDAKDNRDSKDNRRSEKKTTGGGGGRSGTTWMSEKDKAAAEARKAKFAKPAASA
ncbi:hypothetical protein GMOD_00007256 [Pyrenophora seminiperda CCB06]|uniref:SAP domain-containing protein n=1 Tax=Pyrenophora seminiperda CCB06 TaxID=1302712 RepID=A0A3M7MCZ0_9PLEO|nr:hypothetical protein GMOD_00007256 [Pyrenophora seminiperda CCB06]